MQFELFSQHAVHAMDLLQLPRRSILNSFLDGCFVTSLSNLVPQTGPSGLDSRLTQTLMDAWQRLQQSGVLEERGLLDENLVSALSAEHNNRFDVIKSAVLAAGLRSCGLASFSAREAHPAHFKSCAACRTAVYCCREHQVADWSAHKAACKAARKTAAPDKGAGPGAETGARA